MSEVWLYLKKSLHCKPHSSEVHDPKANVHHRSSAQRKKQGKNDCSNIEDFIHGGLRCSEKQPSAPKSQASDAMLNPVTHEIVLDSTSGEIKICPCCPCYQSIKDSQGMEAPRRSTKRTIASMKTHFVDCDECNFFSKPKVALIVQKDSNHEWGERRKTLDTIEEHDISDHSVILLHREDSSWQIIEKICEASYVNGESKAAHIECVLKVQNTQETFACFEECREMVRINAERLQNKHPRCLVDGNELLRFHGTTMACSLGINGSSSLCTLDRCGVCQILRHGFSANQEFHGTVGVFTTSTCRKAIDSIRYSKKPTLRLRRCVIVCRVIAGRINNPLQEIQEMTDSGYDSLVKKISGQSNIEELCVINPRAVLPCFVVIYIF